MANRITKDGKEIIDWLGADGKLVMAADAVTDAIKDLPKEEQRKVLEDAERQLTEQVKATGRTLAELKQEESALKAIIPPELRQRLPGVYEELARLVPPALPGIPDPDQRIAHTVVAGSLAECRWQAEQSFRNQKPADPEKFAHRWYRLGYHTFELTGGLAAALCMTECRGLLGRDFRVPFAAVAVQMPAPSPLVFGPHGDVRFLLLDGREDTMVYTNGYCASGPMPAIGDAEPIEQWLRALQPPRIHVGWQQIVRFVVNLCVYINSLHALPQPEGKRKPSAHGKKSDHEPAPPQRWVIGRAIKLSNGMLQAARAAAVEGATAKQRAAYRMHARFMVRGHWRNQACGTRHSERRLRWIEPFWKGPEMADGLARLYSVSESEAKP